MTAERLLKLFDRVADAPDAVPRLRGLVLDLAVQGRLTGQAVEESRNTELRPGQDQSGSRPAFGVPSNWKWSTIGAVCSKTGSGSTPRGGREVYRSSGVPFLRSQNVHESGPTLEGVAFIERAVHERMTGTAVRPGDLLLNITGGSIGRCAVVPAGFPESNVSQHVAILRPQDPSVGPFLHIAIRSPYFQELIVGAQTGAGRGGLPKNRMDALSVPLPPRDEQRRIVAKVDELMALCDRLEAAQTEREAARHRFGSATVASIVSADTSAVRLSRFDEIARSAAGVTGLRSAVMELAVTGRLVPQHPDDAPLAAPSAMPSRQSSRGNPGPSLPPAGVRTRLPEAWTSGCVADWFEVSGGIQKTPARTPNSNPHPYVGVSNVHRGRLDLHTVKQCELVPGELARFALKPGDLLVVAGNGSRSEVGRCALWSGEIENCVHQNHIIRCRPRADGLSPFTVTYLNSPLGIELLTSLAITSSGLYSLSVGKIRAVPIVMPPLAEQCRIVAKVNQLMTLCDQLEAHLKAGDVARSRLLDALIAETLAEPHVESA